MTAVQDAKPKSPAAGGALRSPQAALRWSQAHSRLAAALGFLIAAVLVPLLALWFMRPAPPKPLPITLARAQAELDKGHDAEARKLVDQLSEEGGSGEGDAGSFAFVQGVLASRQADGRTDENQRRYSLLAARYLIESRELGFPEGREPEAQFLLGKNLFRAGQVEASLEELQAALSLNPDQSTAIHRLLADAYLSQSPPDLNAAFKHISACLEAGNLAANERPPLQLQRAAVLLRQGRISDSRAALAEIPGDSPYRIEHQILDARIQMAEAKVTDADVTQKLEAVAAHLTTIVQDLPETDLDRAAAGYQLGICYQSLGRTADARTEFEKVRALFPGSLESIASGMQEADLLRQEHRDAEAVEVYRSLLESFTHSGASSQHWLALDELRQRWLAAYQHYFDAGEFEIALKVLEAVSRLIDTPTRLELSATTRRVWGQALLAESDHRSQAEGVLRSAGRDFQRLAELRFTTRAYPDHLWASADCFQRAHDYSAARHMLETYLKHEPARRRPLALVRLGECLLLENRPTAALDRFQEAFSTGPADSALFEGRILASQAYLELGDAAAAEKLLLENLNSELLTPASLEWRDSLFALGKLLCLTNRYAESLPRLEEAVRRYPQAHQAVNARYLIGESYRQQAHAALERRDAMLVESARSAQGKEAREHLESAIAAYDAAAASLKSRRELSPPESAVARNCCYMKAAALFDMGRYDESIQAYSTAINEYQHEPEVLDAYVRVADCFRRLKRPLEARGTIEQAKVVLGKLPDATDFSQTSSLDRQEWQKYLEWLGGL